MKPYHVGMTQRDFMGFKYDDNTWIGGGMVGHTDIDFGYGMGRPANISNVEDIYRLEFVVSMSATRFDEMGRQGKQVPMKANVKLGDATSRLEKLLDAENPRLAFAMWLRARIEVEPTMKTQEKRKQELALVGDLEEITLKAINTGRLPNGIHVPSSIFVGSRLPDGNKVGAGHVRSLDKVSFGNVWRWVHRLSPQEADVRIRKYINEYYLEPEFSKMMKGFLAAIDGIKEAKTLNEKLVAFHTALTIAHSTTFVANNLYGMGSVEKLTKLSNDCPQAWRDEVEKLFK